MAVWITSISHRSTNLHNLIKYAIKYDKLKTCMGMMPNVWARMYGLTHWGRDKMDAISRRHFQMHCLNENEWISIKISLKFVLKGPVNNIPTRGRLQVIIWTNDGSVYWRIYASFGLSVGTQDCGSCSAVALGFLPSCRESPILTTRCSHLPRVSGYHVEKPIDQTFQCHLYGLKERYLSIVLMSEIWEPLIVCSKSCQI